MKPTQTDRVINAAKSYRGICAVDFMAPDVIDDGPPITRLAARIFDAERRGFSFEVIGWRKSCKVYRLVSSPDAEVSTGSVLPPSASGDLDAGDAGTLFEVPAGTSHWEGG